MPTPPVPVPAAVIVVLAATPEPSSSMPAWITPLLTDVTVSVVSEMVAVNRDLAKPMAAGTSGGLAPVAVLKSACWVAVLDAAVRLGPT